MRFTSVLLGCSIAYPLFAQHAIVTTNNGPALIGVLNSQTKRVKGYLNIGDVGASALAITPDGTHAYAGLSGYEAIDYLNLSSGAVENQIQVPGAPETVGINPAGTRFYAAYEGDNFQFGVSTYDAGTNRLVHTVLVPGGGAPVFTSEFGFSADRTTLFVAFQGFSILQINALTGALISNTPSSYAPLGFASSGSVVAVTTSVNQQGMIFLLNPATLAELSSITLPTGCAGSIAVDGQGKFAYTIASSSCTSGASTEVLKVDLQSGAVVDRSPTRGRAFAVELSPSQSELYVGETDNVTEIATSSLAGLTEYVQPGLVTAVGVSPAGNGVYAANTTQSTTSYVSEGGVQAGAGLTVSPASSAATQWGIATSTDGSVSYIESALSGAITVVDNKAGKVERFFASPVPPNLIAVSHPSGPLYIVSVNNFASTPSKLTAVDVTTGKAILQTPLDGRPTAIALSPDGSQAWVTSKNDNLVDVFGASTLQQIGTFPATAPYALTFSADSQHCYITLFADNAGILDVDTQTLAVNRTLAPSIEIPSSISISPDNQTLYAIGNGGTLYTVRLSDGSILSSIIVGSTYDIDFAVVSTDGTEVYVADKTNLVEYDTQTGKVTASARLGSRITSLGFTPF